MQNAIDRINLRTMRSPAVVKHYSRSEELLPHERASLEAVRRKVRHAPILDIGVGGGRTVKALREISSDYLGIDYSPEMIEACRRRYPDARFEHADARKLSSLADNSIALAFFSCNGVSMVGHEDRLLIMKEVHRVLKPGGWFVFTTYNRNSPEAEMGFRLPEFEFSANPARLLVRGVRHARDTAISLFHFLKHYRHEERTPHYAVINDRCHNHGVMLYYITLQQQRLQLQEVGFQPNASAFDCMGRPIRGDTTLDSMAMIARKA